MTPEAKVKKKISALLKQYDVYYIMPRGTTFGRAGVHDYVACYYGWYLGVEAKAGKNKPTELQTMEHEAVKAHGGVSLVINETNLDLLKNTLEYMRENPRTQVFTIRRYNHESAPA